MVATEHDLALLRVVAGWAADSAARVLPIFQRAAPADDRPQAAVASIRTFAEGAPRVHRLRADSMGAHRASVNAKDPAAAAAARAAALACSSAWTHLDLLHTGHQHPHIIGAAAYADLARPGEVSWAIDHAPDEVRYLIGRIPPLTPGRTAISRAYAELDMALRGPTG
ncbi:putative immunity protein [Propionibacteriaceae bacterium Y1700]|uniref:putative immunity protein n=1 Tax=Microlunatus sp. Y1700 TaxID=3418487 RepID=UPI003DA75037